MRRSDGGAPTQYTPDLGEEICGLIADGNSIRAICALPGMPSKRVIFNWLDQHEEFARKYEIARQMQAEFWSHEIIAIADDASEDFIITEDGRRVVDHEAINRSRLKVETRKWLLSKLLPKKYGDRVTADITVRQDLRELSDVELLRIASGSSATNDGSEDESSQIH
jgi:hypothetical protein